MILDPREPGGQRTPDRRVVHLGHLEVAVAVDRDGSEVAVPRLVAEVDIGLETPEIRQHVVERPARVPERGPLVEVRRRAADGEPREPRRSADEPAPTELLRLATVGRLRGVAPVRRLGELPAVLEPLGRLVAQVGSGLEEQDRARLRRRRAARRSRSRRRRHQRRRSRTASLAPRRQSRPRPASCPAESPTIPR